MKLYRASRPDGITISSVWANSKNEAIKAMAKGFRLLPGYLLTGRAYIRVVALQWPGVAS